MSEYKFYKTLRQNPPIKLNNVWFISRYKDAKHCLENHDIFSSNKFNIIFERSDLSGADSDLVEKVRLNLGRWFLFSDYTPELLKVKREMTSLLNLYTKDDLNKVIDESLTTSLANLDSKEINLKSDIVVPLMVDLAKFVLKIEKEIDSKEAHMYMYQCAILMQTISYKPKDIDQFDACLTYLDSWAPDHLDDKIKSVYANIIYTMVFNTSNLLGNTLVTMYTNNREWDFTRILDIIKESTRLEAPLKGAMRAATIDTEISGVSIKKEDLISINVGSANRDEEVYGEDADIFRLDRQKGPIITYGIGMHSCVGRKLSLDIGEAAIPKIWNKFKDYTFQEVKWDTLYGQRSAKNILIKANVEALV